MKKIYKIEELDGNTTNQKIKLENLLQLDQISNPWSTLHAFVASASFLKDLGAASGSKNAEYCAALKYFQGPANGCRARRSYNTHYPKAVLSHTKCFRSKIDFIEGELKNTTLANRFSVYIQFPFFFATINLMNSKENKKPKKENKEETFVINDVIFRDTEGSAEFVTTSTLSSNTTEEHDGKQYYVINVEVSSASHPFFTGEERIIDTAGRVEKFNRRLKANK